jgi:hypothetical protein
LLLFIRERELNTHIYFTVSISTIFQLFFDKNKKFK